LTCALDVPIQGSLEGSTTRSQRTVQPSRVDLATYGRLTAGPARARSELRCRDLISGELVGARGLMWAGDDSVAPEIRMALADEAWRVREIALNIVARTSLGTWSAGSPPCAKRAGCSL